MIERNSVNVTLHDVDPTALRQLIDYAYSGEITITEDNVQVRNVFFFTVSLNSVYLFLVLLILVNFMMCIDRSVEQICGRVVLVCMRA